MDTKSRFEQLLEQAQREKPRRARPGNEEERMQAECIRWMEMQYHGKVVYHHSPNEAKRSKVMGARLKAMGMRPGWPDLEILLPGGLVVFVEFKTRKGYLSTAQKEMQIAMASLHHQMYVCRSTEEFIRFLEPILTASYG